MTNHRVHRPRGGFTMVELLVVIGLILFLMTISVVAMSSAIGIARQRATQATLLKIHGLMQQRIDAFNRAMEKTNLQPAIDKLKNDLNVGSRPDDQNKVYEVLVKKQIFRTRFPQNFAESTPVPPTGVTYVTANHQPVTESSALLYWILTSSEVYGIAPVDESAFSSSEVRDTDGDGLNEFVDAWGRPFRFYRWPTHLFRPGNSSTAPGAIGVNSDNSPLLSPIDPKRTYASVLWSGLPAAPAVAGELDPLSRDPDDPTGQLARFVKRPGVATPTAKLTYLQNTYSTPNTYHAFLIVSAGPDGRLGLGEPYSPTIVPATATTTPALGTPQGRLGALDTTVGYVAIELHPINDNLTNRKR